MPQKGKEIFELIFHFGFFHFDRFRFGFVSNDPIDFVVLLFWSPNQIVDFGHGQGRLKVVVGLVQQK